MEFGDIVTKLENADLIEVDDIISNLNEETISSILQNDIPTDIRAVLLLNQFDNSLASDTLRHLGYFITKNKLYTSHDPEYYTRLNTIFSALMKRIEGEFEVSSQRYYSSLDEFEENHLYVSIAEYLSYLQTNYTYQDDEIYRNTLKLYESLTSVISDPGFILTLFENIFYKPPELIHPLKKQLALLYSRYMQHQFDTNIEYFEFLQVKQYPYANLKVTFEQVPFDVVYEILSINLLPDQRHKLVSEITDQERLISLIQLDNLVGSRDKILQKLNQDSILRLINDHQFLDILHMLDNELLHKIFYEVDLLEAKAVIARKLKSNTLAFEVLQQYFDEYGEVYLTSDIVRDLFVLLKLKQLALFRISLPSEYHQMLRDMIREKEKQERNDNSMFM